MKAWYWYHDVQVIKKFLTEDQARRDLIPGENCHHGNTWNSNCAECIEESNGEGLCEHGYDPWGGCDECDKG